MKQWRKSGRYQKSTLLEAAGKGRRWLPVMAVFVAACAPVDAQQHSAVLPDEGKAAHAAAQVSLPPVRQHWPKAVLMSLPPAPETPAALAVVAAREAMNRKQWSILGALVPQAEPDALGMYPQYWLLRYQLRNLPRAQWPDKALKNFMETYAGSYLADRLRGEWLVAAARSGDYGTTLRLVPVHNSNAQIDCATLEARQAGGQKVTADQALAAFKPGASCWAMYDRLTAAGVLGWDQLLPQLRDAVEVDKTDDASRFARYLFEPRDQKTFDRILKEPMKWVALQDKFPVGRNEKELATIALARLARQDINVADSYLRREWAKALPPSNLAWVRSQYALKAALSLDSRADSWYREAGLIRLSEYNAAWRVRAALRQPKIDWKWVDDAIAAMSPQQQVDPAWVYWMARGQAARGYNEQAAQAYAGIASQFNFYGQLAAEELGRRITVPPYPAPVSDAEFAQAQANPGLRRAIYLFRQGWRAEAVPEWNFALRGMNDRQLMAAAELARAENIYDRVVNTSDRTEKEFDFSQRYIAPFEGRVTAKAKAIELDPAWVYGLIRQESRFIIDAKSYVGASGLMQLMPGTAKWVAGKIGMTDFTPASVNDFDTNTVLGTSYLNMVLQDLDGSQVLASAGYNAGPKRPHNWRATFMHPVEGAIFAETIPFTETRLYVKNVMANAVYYAAIFSGQSQSLKERLGTIVPKGPETTVLP